MYAVLSGNTVTVGNVSATFHYHLHAVWVFNRLCEILAEGQHD